MAGDWIKMRTNLDSHPKVIALAAKMGLPELHVIGMLWKLWSWADSHSIDGNAICVTDVTLDRFACNKGFSAALREVGWLTGCDGALSLPNFAEHNGETAKKRLETAARVRLHRARKAKRFCNKNSLPEKRREDNQHTSYVGNARASPEPFRKPTVAEIAAYCRERSNAVDAQRFWDHYESNGWRVGRAAMKDWRAAVRNWERNEGGLFSGQQSERTQSHAQRTEQANVTELGKFIDQGRLREGD